MPKGRVGIKGAKWWICSTGWFHWDGQGKVVESMALHGQVHGTACLTLWHCVVESVALHG